MKEEEIIELAVKTAIDHVEKQRLQEIKSRHDRRLRNTRLLLKNYHLFKTHCSKSIYSSAMAGNAIDVLDSIHCLDKHAYIESIKSSVTRTAIIIAHIDRMLKFYRIYCETSDRPEDMRRFRVLNAVYFENASIDDVCLQENIDRRTYFRDTNDAFEKLSSLIFGFDGLSSMSQ